MLLNNISILYYGVFSILAQLILLRELSVVFYGNELFLGVALASWLFWVGLGSFLARKFHIKGLGSIFIILSVLLPLEVILIRVSKALFYFGSFIAPLPMAAITFFSLSIFCIVLGVLFPTAVSLIARDSSDKAALKKVYFLECLGSVLGGILFTYVLIGRVSVFSIALILSLGCIILARIKPIWIVILSGILVLFLFAGSSRIDQVSRQIEWKGYNLVAQTESRYSHLALAQVGGLRVFFENGLVCAHFPDPRYYEEIVHWPFLLAQRPERLLVVGNATTGILKEALKYRLKEIDYLELDNKIVALLKHSLDTADLAASQDKRLTLHNVDARVWLKNKLKPYDVIILNVAEPSNAQINRYYTREFYQAVRWQISPNGILALSVPSAENYLAPEIQAFNASIYKTLKSVFKYVELLPGDNLIILASASPINIDEGSLIKRYEELNLSNIYVVPTYFKDKLSMERRAYVRNILESAQDSKVNSDFKPITYYYYAKLWLGKFSSPIYFLILLIGLASFIWIGLQIYRLCAKIAVHRYNIFIFTLGFIGMLTEVILIFSFQAVYGYIWWQMGALFAAFMLGLTLGSGFIKDSSLRALNILMLSLAIFIFALLKILILTTHLSSQGILIIYPILLLILGCLIGAGFPLSGYLAISSEGLIKVSSLLYSWDAWGGALAALFCGTIIIPLLGILGSLYLALIAAILLIWILRIKK